MAATADSNGDGKSDLAVAKNGSNDVSVLVGNGNGTFLPAVNYASGSSPVWEVVGDFMVTASSIWSSPTTAATISACY